MSSSSLEPSVAPAVIRGQALVVADRGVRVVAVYKLVRAVVVWLVSGGLLILAATGRTHELHEAAVVLRDHVSNALMLMVAKLLVNALSARHLYMASLALALDGGLSFVEGWTLRRGLWWGPLLVLATTGSLLPFEIVYLVRRFRAGRVLVLLVNLAIFLYLARRMLSERRRARGLAGSRHG